MNKKNKIKWKETYSSNFQKQEHNHKLKGDNCRWKEDNRKQKGDKLKNMDS